MVNGKNVDFLFLEDKIVLECDGDIHIDFKKIDVNANTAWRNMALLYGGYKVVAVCLHELNLFRTVPELQQLILKKIDLLKKEQAVLV
jgi:very-short-patch-repair endonuclease